MLTLDDKQATATIKVASRPDIQPGQQPDEPNIQPGQKPEPQPDIQPDTQPEIQPQTPPEIRPPSSPEIVPDTPNEQGSVEFMPAQVIGQAGLNAHGIALQSQGHA